MSRYRWNPILNKSWTGLALLSVLLCIFFLRWIPHGSVALTEGDSGIFLYIGQQINHGLSPYVDVWDNKGPLLFYLNALGLRLATGAPVGIVALTAGFALTFLCFTWLSIRRASGTAAAFFGILLAQNLLPGICLSPNTSELYAVAFQACAFFLLVHEFEPQRRALWFPILQGLLASALFQLRPNNAGVSFLYFLAFTYQFVRLRAPGAFLRHAGLMTASFLMGNMLILSSLILHGHMSAYLDGTLLFASRYSLQTPLVRHFYAVGVGLLKISPYGASIVSAIVGYGTFAAVRAKTARWSGDRKGRYAILAFALFVIEILCTSISGKAFEHYFIMWLLPVSLFAGLFVEKCTALASASGPEGSRLARVALQAACTVLLISSLFESARTYGKAEAEYQDNRASVIQFIRERSARSDALFVWGDFGAYAFRLGLRPASRHFSSIGMGVLPSAYRDMGSEALRDVEKNKPRFVIESTLDGVPPLFASVPGRGATSAAQDDELKIAKQALGQRYRLVFTDASGTNVYSLISVLPTP